MSATPASITVDLDVPANRPSRAVAIPTTTANVQVTGRDSVLTGWSFRETTGTAGAIARLIDGKDANAQLVAAISLSSGQAVALSLAPGGLLITTGLYLDMVSGSIEGAVWVRWSRE